MISTLKRDQAEFIRYAERINAGCHVMSVDRLLGIQSELQRTPPEYVDVTAAIVSKGPPLIPEVSQMDKEEALRFEERSLKIVDEAKFLQVYIQERPEPKKQ
jgi:hypothetical protein